MDKPKDIPASTFRGDTCRLNAFGEAARQVCNHHWQDTELGPIDHWPLALVAVVNLAINSPAVTAVHWGRDHIFVGNDASVRMFGSNSSEPLGLPASELWGENWRHVRNHFEGVLTRGESCTKETLPVKMTRADKDKDSLLTYSLSPIYDGGVVAGVYATFAEVNREAQALRSLAEANEQLRMALSLGTSVGFWDWDIQSGIVRADRNVASLYELDSQSTEAGVSHLAFEHKLHPEDVAKLTDAIMDCILSGREYSADYRVRRSNGSFGWVRSMGQCIYDEHGHASRVTGLKHDITEMRQGKQSVAVPISPLLQPAEEWLKIPAKLKSLIEGTLVAVVERPEDIRLEVASAATGTDLILRVASSDLGLIIGKQGKTIRAFRTLLSAVNKGSQYRYTVNVQAR